MSSIDVRWALIGWTPIFFVAFLLKSSSRKRILFLFRKMPSFLPSNKMYSFVQRNAIFLHFKLLIVACFERDFFSLHQAPPWTWVVTSRLMYATDSLFSERMNTLCLPLCLTSCSQRVFTHITTFLSEAAANLSCIIKPQTYRNLQSQIQKWPRRMINCVIWWANYSFNQWKMNSNVVYQEMFGLIIKSYYLAISVQLWLHLSADRTNAMQLRAALSE